MAPTMVKPRKKDTSEEMSYLVDYHIELSNFYASYARLVRLTEYLGRRRIRIYLIMVVIPLWKR